MSTRRRISSLSAAAAVTALTVSCGNDDPSADIADLQIPAPEGSVTTQFPTIVMDTGEGAELCLGPVAESYPPQCGGPALEGWDWDEQDPENFEEEQGTRWGEYVVAGVYDPDQDTFEMESAEPGDEWEGEFPEAVDELSTPCEEPEGGWEILDAELVSEERMNQTFARAEELEGYAGAWMDQSPNPVQPEDLNDPSLDDDERQELEAAQNDPELVIINVRVTEDAQGAYDTLREEWGGMLCVTETEHDQAELEDIQQELTDIDGVQTAGVDPTTNQVTLTVTYDDGSLESQLGEIFGEGTVSVSSLLVADGES